MFIRRDKLVPETESRDRWLISYADLVTLLLALFIVMYAASDHERAKQIANSINGEVQAKPVAGTGILPGSTSLTDERAKIQAVLNQNPLFNQKAKLLQTERGLIVSLAEAGFFESGGATVNNDAASVLEALADSLKDSNAPIRVEGHTDATPISTARYPSNWELSTARASAVLAKFIERGIRPERLSAAGYAGFQPVADNSTAEGRAQNRRVDVVIIKQ